MTFRLLLHLAVLLLLPLTLGAQQRFAGSDNLDAIVAKAVEDHEIPGAVLLIGQEGEVLHRAAYGFRALVPRREKMTLETIFDAASLTKVVATAPSIMKLVEEGRVRLNDRVTAYLPEFQGGESRITVRHLLTHFSGLRPDVDLEPEWEGHETGVDLALVDEPVARPGERFIYSDINYILLGEIVQEVSGKSLPEFAAERFFQPLGMNDTQFQPPKQLLPRVAPTEKVPEFPAPLRGIVHDPTTRFMGGVAGHAGIFTTADDLARFAQMLLGQGQYHNVRVLQPLTVRKMTTPQSPVTNTVLRGIGWDIDSPFSTNRGELLPLGSYGHTGFTGTSMWMDPTTGVYIILMANRVHPDGNGSIVSLRSRVASVTAAALGVDLPGVSLTGYNETLVGGRRRSARNGQVMTGLDVLAADGFEQLMDKRVGLITNHTGLSRDGERNIDLMVNAGVNVTALFSPEHGIAGTLDTENIDHAKDKATGVPVWSLYSGGNRRPSEQMLQKADLLVFDIQDVGARFYTYMCTMLNAMEEAAKADLEFVVLDRPNPITGVRVEGPMLDDDLQSFIGCAALPLRHGMTLGEIAVMENDRRGLGTRLKVVKMKGWQRGDWFDSTGLGWVNPSPNMRSLNAALLYPGLAMLEGSSNYSVGRGTDSPFEQVGADWINGRELATVLNARRIEGVRVYPTRFRPDSSKLSGKWIEGVRFVVTDRELLYATRLGLEVAAALTQLYPDKVEWKSNERLIGNRSTIDALRRGVDPVEVEKENGDRLVQFEEIREKHLLYQ
jgi:uncharacterized protein YbbC (DUF1343 family)/CubicO group peptidase (beta-lactamase class C family)